MSPISKIVRFVSLGGLLIPLSTPMFAETASSAETDEEVQVLSPFIVKKSRDDIGYYTENTLAGSRLSTNLGDLGASITVVTRQQMLDTASIDMNDVFMYEANTEGTENNYTSFSFDGTSFRDQTQASPVTANRIRGIGSADRSHNYYSSLSAIPFDLYNTETVDINRGPNSLLFGIGSAAGTVNQTSSSASVGAQTAEVGARYGTDDAFRTSFRVNVPAAHGKFAVLAAALYDKRGFQRKPSFDDTYRQYLAVTWNPTKKLNIRANFENYRESSRIPNSVTPQDGVSEWRAAGSPTWNPLTFTVTRNGQSKVVPNSNFNNEPALQLGAASLPTMYYDNGSGSSRPLLWMQSALSPTGITGPFPATLPRLAASSTMVQKLQNSTMPLFNIRGITDQSIYDWTSINSASGVHNAKRAKIYNVEVDYQLTANFFAHAGWYREDYWSKFNGYNGAGFIQIDPNVVLLDGSPNPFFLRPYLTFGGNQQDEITDTRNDNFRVSLAYVLDLSKRNDFLRWFGLNRFFAFGERHDIDAMNVRSTEVVLDSHSWVNPAAKSNQAPGAINVATVLKYQMYLGDKSGNISYGPGDVIDGPIDLALRHAIPQPDGTFTWVNESAHLDQALQRNTNHARQTDDSFTLGWQGSLFNNRVVPTLGFRRDRNISDSSVGLVSDPTTGLLDTSTLNTFNPSLNSYGNTRTAGVVVRPLKWLGLTYSQSRNFTPSAYKVDIFGNPLTLPTGQGKDYGVRISLLDNKLVASLNYFEASANHARGTPADGFMFREARFETGFITWATGIANGILGPSASADAVAKKVAEITKLPEGYTPPPLGTIGSSSTVDAKGVEAQVIFNPIPNWNMKATLGTQKTTYSAIAPEFDAYTTPRLPIWMAAVDPVTGTSFWSTNSSQDLGIPVNFWNQNIASPMQLAKSLEGKRTQGQREWSASGISTYRFISGPLKGFGLGGGVRLQDRAIIGYRGAEPDSSGVIRSLDPSKPIFDHANPAFDAWIYKEFRLPQMWGRDVRAKVQLNVKNLTEDGNWLQPIAVNPDGVHTVYRIVEPRKWYLDVTFSF